MSHFAPGPGDSVFGRALFNGFNAVVDRFINLDRQARLRAAGATVCAVATAGSAELLGNYDYRSLDIWGIAFFGLASVTGFKEAFEIQRAKNAEIAASEANLDASVTSNDLPGEESHRLALPVQPTDSTELLAASEPAASLVEQRPAVD